MPLFSSLEIEKTYKFRMLNGEIKLGRVIEIRRNPNGSASVIMECKELAAVVEVPGHDVITEDSIAEFNPDNAMAIIRDAIDSLETMSTTIYESYWNDNGDKKKTDPLRQEKMMLWPGLLAEITSKLISLRQQMMVSSVKERSDKYRSEAEQFAADYMVNAFKDVINSYQDFGEQASGKKSGRDTFRMRTKRDESLQGHNRPKR